MRSFVLSASLLSLLPSILAFTFTSPSTSATIDPSQPFQITWTSDSSDPATISFNIHETNSAVLAEDETLANGVQTNAHSFTVPANTVQQFGTGFVVQALNGGSVIATSGQFAFAAGSGAVSTLSNGQETFISVTTAATVPAPAPTDTGTATAVVQTTNASPSATEGATTTAGTAVSTATSGAFSFVTGTATSGAFSFATDTSSGLATSTRGSKSTSEATSTTVVDTSSSTAGSAATSTGLACNVRVGALGLMGGLAGAIAVFV